MFYMCCLDILVTTKDQVVKYMRHCLWRKKNNDVQAQGKAMVGWNKICRPKNRGGFGVLNWKLKIKLSSSKKKSTQIS
jgi:hypothetical protein